MFFSVEFYWQNSGLKGCNKSFFLGSLRASVLFTLPNYEARVITKRKWKNMAKASVRVANNMTQ